MENSEARVADAATPGQRLRDAREAAGISPREMADRLNWLPTYVAAIEEDRYESMRSPAFVRGYLRAYARAVGLNADELVAGFDALLGGGVEEREMVLPTSPASNQKTGLSVIMGTIIAVLVIGFLWWQGQEDEGRPAGQAAEDRESAAASAAQTASAMSASANSARDAAASPVAGSADGKTGSEPPAATQVAGQATGDDGAAPADTTIASEENEVSDAAAEAGTADSAESDAESSVADDVDETAVATPAPATAASGTAAAPTAILEFEFSGDCWLEVRDASGALIYADLERAGDTVQLDGEPPFDVLTGNAGAVAVRYRGEPFPVGARPGRDTARFTVGGQ